MKQKFRVLGELESEVMDLLWRSEPMAVKEVAERLARSRAYNTVQTTLDRLYRKGMLRRDKQSHAFVYEPRISAAEYHGEILSNVVAELLPKNSEPVLSRFVDMAGDADLENLERLEKLIQAKREKQRGKG